MTNPTKSSLSRMFAVSLMTTLFSLGVIPASAQYLTNGNFEVEPLGLDSAATTFPGWTEGSGAAAINAPVAIGGNYSARLALVTAGNLAQTLVDTNNELSQWVFQVDFACSDPGSGASRSFQPVLRHTPTGLNQIAMRVVDVDGDDVGDVQFFNNSAWVTALPNAVTFSPSDASLNVNRLTIVGHYSDAIPNYDVYLTNAAAVVFSALGQTNYQGTKPTAGTTLRALSFETGNYVSGAFSVVDNVAISSFGSAANAPVVTSQPANQTVLEGASTVTFTAGISGTPPIFAQWRLDATDIPGATNAPLSTSTLTLSNISVSMAGNYSLFLSNAVGVTVSSNALLTVRPVANTTQMSNIWNLLPVERPYLAASGNTERGLAFNPATSNLLVASRAGGSNTIAVLDPAAGTEKHLLNLSGVGGGSIDLNTIAVTDDGVVFAANATVDASSFSIPYQIYRWADDSATATAGLVFSGDPGAGDAAGLRWGDNIAVRGTGADTQILIAPGSGTNVVMLQTISGLDFQTEIPPKLIAINLTNSGFAQNLAWGPGTNTFWSKNWGGSLRLIEFDLNSSTGRVLHAYNDAVVPRIQTELIAIAADNEGNILAGVAVETPDNVRLYNVADLVAGPVLRDQELFTVDNPNPTLNGTGAATFGNDYLFVLDSNNGIKAFLINTNFTPQLPPFRITSVRPDEGSAIVLTWDSVTGHSYQVLAKDSLTDPIWEDVSGTILATSSATSFTNAVSGINHRFYRVQGQ